jgi:hypothetical protein
MAAELRTVGIDLSFAPCVDIDYGVSRAIGDRALHADAAAVGELAVAYMLGMREAGMAATAKHFPGHGAVAADSHVALPVDRREWPDSRRPDAVPLADRQRPAGRDGRARAVPGRGCAAGELLRPLGRHVLRASSGSPARCSPTTCRWRAPPSTTSSAGRARHCRGCDVLPVCNDRANLTPCSTAKIDGSASRLRLAHARPARRLGVRTARERRQQMPGLAQRCTATTTGLMRASSRYHPESSLWSPEILRGVIDGRRTS